VLGISGWHLEGGTFRSFECGFGMSMMMLGFYRMSTGICLAVECKAIGLFESIACAMSRVVARAKVQVCGSLAIVTFGREGCVVET
jgi:hypothetical protein